MVHAGSDVDAINQSIAKRWNILDWDKVYPWWRRPSNVRILVYADGLIHLQGGSFQGMQYVYQLLKSRAYSYVNFSVSFAHRDGADPSATIKGAMRLTDLDVMNNFDEILVLRIQQRSEPHASRAGASGHVHVRAQARGHTRYR
ncbi:hypothetical protein [Paraburkholderia sp. SIMBA_054]|uniref:hypothetical protein n=1 Tax=Paraburkholderia sp. SIMBA_054 TaxID=3085795 RepID=UPI00397BBA78